jgi:Lar family restriction alleviation protein
MDGEDKMNHEDAAPEKGIELKPCPFCGGDAKLEGEQAGQDCVSYVFCLRCDVEGETWRSDNWVFSKNKAIEAWNARADLAAPEQSAGEVADSEQLAQMFHETYERLAPSFGYETRKSSAKPWADVPENNKRLMIAVCREIQAATCSSQPTGDRAKALEDFSQPTVTEEERAAVLAAFDRAETSPSEEITSAIALVFAVHRDAIRALLSAQPSDRGGKQYYRSREFYIEYFSSVLCRMDNLDPKRWRAGSETFEWTEFEQHAECILDAILQDFPNALRIIRAEQGEG